MNMRNFKNNIKKLRRLVDFFCFKDEDEALVAGFAGSGAFDGMYEAIEILKKDRERDKKNEE